MEHPGRGPRGPGAGFGVPNALLLASLAGLLDVIPVLGFVIAVIPAVMFAASVSASAAWMVFALYIAYHALENYLIVPLDYGNRMRLGCAGTSAKKRSSNIPLPPRIERAKSEFHSGAFWAFCS